MVPTPAGVHCDVGILDYLTVNVIAQVCHHDNVRAALRLTVCNSRWDLPAEVVIYYLIAMAFFRAVSLREVL